jgi:hypothetical protein
MGSEFMLANDMVEPRHSLELIELGERGDESEANIADNVRKVEVLSN